MNLSIKKDIDYDISNKKCKVNDTILKLNGVGIRKVFMIEAYRSFLYCSECISSKEGLIELSNVIRFSISFTYGPISIDRMKQAWQDALLKNSSEYELEQENNIINIFMSTICEYQKKDVVVYDILGAEVSIFTNGVLDKIIHSDFLANAIIDIFVGVNPIDEKMRDGLLGN